MASKVYLHVGLPKTATSYLQTVAWGARDQMRNDGVLLPGHERRDHLWASRVVREDPYLAKAPRPHRTSWQRLLEELRGWHGTGLISHEFFAAASADQARRAIADLAPAEVHLVVTAREPLGLFTASWQESLKNKRTTPMADYARHGSKDPGAIWNWRTLDLRLVLRRWAATLPPQNVHVLALNRQGPRELIWHQFAGLLALPSAEYDLSGSFSNESMGVVEAETLRRINEKLEGFDRAFDKGVWIRTFLADERLAPRGGDRFWPGPDRIAECRDRGERAVAFLSRRGFDVRGNVEDLLVPRDLEPRRTPSSVTDAEVAEVAVQLVARLLCDVRELTARPSPDRGTVGDG